MVVTTGRTDAGMSRHYVTAPGFIFKIEWTARQKFASRLVDDSILLCPGTGCSMTTTTTIDRAQAEKAVNALLKHHEKVTAERADTELIERDEHVWLVVNTKRGSTKRKAMPKRM